MREWKQHKDVLALGPSNPRCDALLKRHASQTIVCMSRTVEGQHKHSLPQRSMPDEEDRDCAPNKRKAIAWTPNVFLHSPGHDRGFSIGAGFSGEKVQRDWVTFCCHAGATTGAHEHILTALQTIFTKAGQNGSQASITQPRTEEGRSLDQRLLVGRDPRHHHRRDLAPRISRLKRKTRPQRTGLQKLDLFRCSGLTALPESMVRLTGLQKLDLSHCSWLTALPESMGSLTGLQELDLSYCSGLTALPESMGRLTGLQGLDLRDCPIVECRD